MKYLNLLTTAVIVAMPLSLQAASNSNTVEIMLSNTLDEDRGYCLDVAGGQGENAPLDKGLQAHTCYHYKGSILVDQGFDEALISEGKFKIPYFDVCMTATSVTLNSTIVLASCEQLDSQKFTLNTNGQIVTQTAPELCITVSSTEKREGRGSTPVHVMRPLSLQNCEEGKSDYQQWEINKL